MTSLGQEVRRLLLAAGEPEFGLWPWISGFQIVDREEEENQPCFNFLLKEARLEAKGDSVVFAFACSFGNFKPYFENAVKAAMRWVEIIAKDGKYIAGVIITPCDPDITVAKAVAFAYRKREVQ